MLPERPEAGPQACRQRPTAASKGRGPRSETIGLPRVVCGHPSWTPPRIVPTKGKTPASAWAWSSLRRSRECKLRTRPSNELGVLTEPHGKGDIEQLGARQGERAPDGKRKKFGNCRMGMLVPDAPQPRDRRATRRRQV